jgi:hypothetical protein
VQPSALLPPIENELAEDDFNIAVTTHLYSFERRRAVEELKAQANRTGFELARILAPLFGGEVKERGDEPTPARHEHTFVDGACTGCDLRNTNGVFHHGPLPVECGEHVFVNDVCATCGGAKLESGHVTKASPRTLGRCEHKNWKPSGGELLCLDCGARGN